MQNLLKLYLKTTNSYHRNKESDTSTEKACLSKNQKKRRLLQKQPGIGTYNITITYVLRI